MDAMAKSLCTGSDGFVFSVFCFLFSVFFFFFWVLSQCFVFAFSIFASTSGHCCRARKGKTTICVRAASAAA